MEKRKWVYSWSLPLSVDKTLTSLFPKVNLSEESTLDSDQPLSSPFSLPQVLRVILPGLRWGHVEGSEIQRDCQSSKSCCTMSISALSPTKLSRRIPGFLQVAFMQGLLFLLFKAVQHYMLQAVAARSPPAVPIPALFGHKVGSRRKWSRRANRFQPTETGQQVLRTKPLWNTAWGFSRTPKYPLRLGSSLWKEAHSLTRRPSWCYSTLLLSPAQAALCLETVVGLSWVSSSCWPSLASSVFTYVASTVEQANLL